MKELLQVAKPSRLSRLHSLNLLFFGQSFIIVHCLQVTGPICGRTSKKITYVLGNLLAQIRWSMVIHVMPTSHGVHVRSYHVLHLVLMSVLYKAVLKLGG